MRVLVGSYQSKHLYFATTVRAGFTPRTRAEVFRRIAKHQRKQCPFMNLPNSTGISHWGERISTEDMKTLRWARPVQVVEIAFVEWTRDGLRRHPKFIGVRDDKQARCVR